MEVISQAPSGASGRPAASTSSKPKAKKTTNGRKEKSVVNDVSEDDDVSEEEDMNSDQESDTDRRVLHTH